jgi:hypothetical protein
MMAGTGIITVNPFINRENITVTASNAHFISLFTYVSGVEKGNDSKCNT